MCVGYTNNKTYSSHVDREMLAHVWTLTSEGRHSNIHCLHATQITDGKDWEQNVRDDKGKEVELSEVLG